MFASDDPRSTQRELEACATVEHSPRSSMDAQWPVAIQPGEPRGCSDRMALFSACRLRAIDQSARPDALATGRPVVEQTKPLRAAKAPRANEHRPRCAARNALPESHTTGGPRDMTGAVVGLMTLLLALVLGLSIWTAYGVFSTQKASVQTTCDHRSEVRRSVERLRAGGGGGPQNPQRRDQEHDRPNLGRHRHRR